MAISTDQRRFFALGIATLLLVLGGCARPDMTLPGGSTAFKPSQPATHAMTWSARTAQLRGLRRWVIQGAFSLRRQGKTTMASLYWRQLGGQYTLTLSGPMSMGKVRIEGKPGQVTLSQSAKQAHASSPERLMTSQLGWSLPVSNMVSWIKGLPVPGVPAKKTFDRYHHLTQLAQAGWQIQYSNYRAFANIDLPMKILLNNPRAAVRIVIKRWVV